jgi:hypothetical protein
MCNPVNGTGVQLACCLVKKTMLKCDPQGVYAFDSRLLADADSMKRVPVLLEQY